jgi:phage shock protein A
MALVVTELSAKFSAQTSEFQQGVETVKSGLTEAEQKAKEAAAAADAAWKQMAATASAQAGIQQLGTRVDRLVAQAGTLSPALQKELGGLQSTLQNLAGKPYSLELRANVAQARAELATIQRQATIEVRANTTPAITALERLRGVASGVMDMLGKFGLAGMGIQMLTSTIQGASNAHVIHFNAGK